MQIISHIALACKDPSASERFYTEHFGFRRARTIALGDGEEIVFLKMQDCAFYLELFRAKEPARQPAFTKDGPWFPGIRHLAFKVSDVDAKLAEIGSDAELTLGPLDFKDFIPGWRTVWVADPDGNIVEISQGFTDE